MLSLPWPSGIGEIGKIRSWQSGFGFQSRECEVWGRPPTELTVWIKSITRHHSKGGPFLNAPGSKEEKKKSSSKKKVKKPAKRGEKMWTLFFPR